MPKLYFVSFNSAGCLSDRLRAEATIVHYLLLSPRFEPSSFGSAMNLSPVRIILLDSKPKVAEHEITIAIYGEFGEWD